MTSYWKYWKRGWWAFLFLLVVNTPAGLALKLLNAWLPKDAAAYHLLMFALFLVALIPFTGVVFEFFAGRSQRLRAAVEPPRSSA